MVGTGRSPPRLSCAEYDQHDRNCLEQLDQFAQVELDTQREAEHRDLLVELVSPAKADIG